MSVTAPDPHPKSAPPPAWRVWAGRLALVVAGLVIGLLLVEVLLRVTARMGLLPITLHDTLSDVRLVPWSDETVVPPQLVRTDSYFGSISRQADHYLWEVGGHAAILDLTTYNWLDPKSHVGFRVPDTSWQPRWPVDAVVVGDSFTFCFVTYPECWVSKLQSDYGLSMVNLGLPATGSVSHERVLDTFGLAYKPRIVLWQWWGNDSYEDTLLYAIQHPKPDKGGEVPGPCTTPSSLQRWLDTYSALGAMTHGLGCAVDPLAVDPYHVTSGAINLTFGSVWFRVPLDMSTKENKKGWPMTQDALLAANQMANGIGAKLVIVLIPAKEEVYQKLTEPYLGAQNLAIYSEGRNMMLGLCKTRGLTCFDVTPVLTQHANAGEQVYWPSDIHLNPAGNAILAQAVDDFLKAQGLVK